MRAFHDGRVALNGLDIQAFNSNWPGSCLNELEGVTFGFDSQGNLHSIWPWNGEVEQWDGEELRILSERAQKYLAKRHARHNRDWKRREQLRNNAQGNLFLGRRVQLSPSCELWMRGARFGTIVGSSHHGIPYDPSQVVLRVKMDHSQVRKIQNLSLDLVTFL